MDWEMKPLSARMAQLIDMHASHENALGAALSLVKDALGPYCGDTDMTYRYEHTLRVAAKGQMIADGEGWDREPLLLACLLHDIGYSECKTAEDFGHHPEISAEIARRFLDKTGYDMACTQEICRAIVYHARNAVVPEGASAFALSVRDADDLDGYDVMRTCIRGSLIIGVKGSWMAGGHSAEEIISGCTEQLARMDEEQKRVCGTKTAQRLWEEQLIWRKRYYETLREQMQTTLDMEQSLRACGFSLQRAGDIV